MQSAASSPAPFSTLTVIRRRRENPVGLLVDIARAADFIRIPWWGGLIRANVMSTPELAHAVLVDQADAFVKGYGLSYFARPLLGDGLLTSEHDFHHRQRRLMAPAFTHKRIADYAGVIAARAEAAQQALGDGASVDVSAAMMRLTLEIVGATLFGAEVGAEADEIGAALTAAMEHVVRPMRSVIPIPPTWPTPSNRRGMAAIARLDRTVYRLIEEHRRDGRDRGDF